uniref:Uncharacterized protein n=1 Tax=Astyanax mexicanus TaxID=7994 RepID=A0A3B1JR20_ASTMX
NLHILSLSVCRLAPISRSLSFCIYLCVLTSLIGLPQLFWLLVVETNQDQWSSWSGCSVSCGEGWQSRTRNCMTSALTTLCTGPLRENRPCNNSVVCPVNGAWDEWAPWSLCSSTCGRGYRDRVRVCKPPNNGGEPCRGPTKQTKFCNIAVCPVDGSWNDWSAWSPCSASCSNGTMQRTRECNGPSYGGSECRGDWRETSNCFLKDCPVDGRWLSWSSWGSCSKTCGGGSQQRQRVCEGPFFGGEPCVGDKAELRRCNEKRCPGTKQIHACFFAFVKVFFISFIYCALFICASVQNLTGPSSQNHDLRCDFPNEGMERHDGVGAQLRRKDRCVPQCIESGCTRYTQTHLHTLIHMSIIRMPKGMGSVGPNSSISDF